jgi:amino acid transporter
MPYGTLSVITTSGLIFVSFGGLTKVCSVAEECKKPGRTIPLGIFLSWGLISLIYLLVIFVTVGLVSPNELGNTYTPISLGADSIHILGSIGGGIMAIAAILAFISTANAGILASSRNPMAMGKDQLLPKAFAFVSKRGTPTYSIIFTTAFMIFVILFLDLEGLIKTASTLKILLFLLVTISVIIMRESKIRNYRPKFKAPLYPYVHIAGIIGFIFLILQMGIFPIILVACFIGFSFAWYWIYARDKIWREYTLLHIIERLTGMKSSGYLVDEELRGILIERDDITEKRFEEIVNKSEIIDIYKYVIPEKIIKMVSKRLTDKLDINEKKLLKLLKKRQKDSSVTIHPGIAIFSHIIKGRDKFELLIVRSKKGIILSDDINPVRAFFIIVASPDQNNFYLHVLMWIIQIAEEIDFNKEWIESENVEELRKIIIKAWKKRKSL